MRGVRSVVIVAALVASLVSCTGSGDDGGDDGPEVVAPTVDPPRTVAPPRTVDPPRIPDPPPAIDVPVVRAPEIRSPSIVVRQDDAVTIYSVEGDVLFDFDEDALRDDAIADLAEIVDSIEDRFPGAPITVAGHTDSVGDPDYNQDLSERRAEAVLSYLVDEAGFDPALIEAEGYGATRPVEDEGPNDPEDAPARQANRRVEIVVHTTED